MRVLWTGVGVVGFVLSPLSWWNDLWVNLPLSYLAANIAAWFNPRWFMSVLIGSYLATNVLGFWLMQMASQGSIQGKGRPITRKAIVTGLLMALAYTAVAVIMYQLGWIRPLVGQPR